MCRKSLVCSHIQSLHWNAKEAKPQSRTRRTARLRKAPASGSQCEFRMFCECFYGCGFMLGLEMSLWAAVGRVICLCWLVSDVMIMWAFGDLNQLKESWKTSPSQAKKIVFSWITGLSWFHKEISWSLVLSEEHYSLLRQLAEAVGASVWQQGRFRIPWKLTCGRGRGSTVPSGSHTLVFFPFPRDTGATPWLGIMPPCPPN